MSKEIAIPDQLALSRELAGSNLLPAQYRGNPANLLFAIQYAEALQVHPITAVNGIHVIEGKPSASAQLIAGLVRRAGHKLRVRFDREAMVATAEIIRVDDTEYTYTSSWDMSRASAAGLTGKGVWKKFPDAMLKARAITEVARDACSEALFGVIYTAEELGFAEVDEDGAAVITTVTAAPADGWAAATAPVEALPVPEFADVDEARAYWKSRKAAGAGADELAQIADAAAAFAAVEIAAEEDVVDAELVEDAPAASDDDLWGLPDVKDAA